jgi:tartrate-resistant acid phosphatase type 5
LTPRARIALLGSSLCTALLLLFVIVNGWGSSWFHRPPPAAELDPVPTADPAVVRFVAVGDAGELTPALEAVGAAIPDVCKARGCDFGLLLGDNKYPAGVEGPQDDGLTPIFAPLDDTGLTWYVVLGNHDYGDSTHEEYADAEIAWAKAHPRFVLPARTYAFTAGPATFFALDTTAAFWDGGGAQAAWFDAGVTRSVSRWNVAFGHHPIMSDGMHGNVGDYEGHSWLPFASGGELAELLLGHVCGNADLYVAGHDHVLDWPDGGDCDTQLIVSGAGAKPREIVDRGNPGRFRAGNTPGFAWIELGDAMTVAFYGGDGALLFEGTAPRSER